MSEPPQAPPPRRIATAAPPPESAGDSRRLAERVLRLFGLAYLLLAALTSGLVWSSYVLPLGDEEPKEAPPRREPPPDPVPEPTPEPDKPAIHVRPDGSRYLIMRLPSDIGERLRGHTQPMAIGGAR